MLTSISVQNLRSWASMDIRDPGSLKGLLAELAAALGPALVSQLIVKIG